MSKASQLFQRLTPLISTINQHPLYKSILNLTDLAIFMEQHVFAVWDFMCLLKTLHSQLVSTQAPWFPPLDTESARLINELLIEEESDILPDELTYQSHFETYLNAMHQVGANTQPIKNFLSQIKEKPLTEAISTAEIPCHVKQFVETTFSFFKLTPHELATAFVFGREAITQSMFQPLLTQIEQQLPHDDKPKLKLIQYYFNRHITLDSEQHLPKALQMLTRLCGDDPKKWQACEITAGKALTARLEFLTGINQTIHHQ